MNCNICNNEIIQERVQLGYKTCIQCSVEEQVGCISVVYHKTGNTIEITSKKIATKVAKLSARSSFGTMKCLKSKKSNSYNPKSTTHKLHIQPVASNEEYTQVLEQIVNSIDKLAYTDIIKNLDKLVLKHSLSGVQRSNILSILDHLTEKKTAKEPIRYLLNSEKEPVLSEIDYAFINWKNK